MKTAGTFDDKLMLLDRNVSATTTGSWIDFNGDDMDELNVRAIVALSSGTNQKCVLTYQGTDDKETVYDLYTFPDITEVGEYSHKVRGLGRYRRITATVSGTDPTFALKVGISTGGVFKHWEEETSGGGGK